MKVYKRAENGTETYVAGGAYVYGSATGLVSAAINIPSTSLNSLDAIVVYVCYFDPDLGEDIMATFVTEQLGASELESATWTVYYYIYKSGTLYYFRFGTSTYNSRITNFKWSAKSWKQIVNWVFGVAAKSWYNVGSWGFDVAARAWSQMGVWAVQMLTVGKVWRVITFCCVNISTVYFPLVLLLLPLFILVLTCFWVFRKKG
ncbi:MAG: hypothetical protein ACKD6O_08155 [Candidatus Bathyarchaeota archaeon]